MGEELKNSIKAKLYDFAYTPFMSSVLIAWVFINHKYLLVLFAEYDLEKKLPILRNWDFAFHTPWFTIPYMLNSLVPILFGLFYVFAYPKINKKFYEYTLERNKELKKIKQDIEDETPITQEKARELKREHYKLADERDQALEKLKESQKEYAEVLVNALKPLQDEIEAYKVATNVSNTMIDSLKAEKEKFTSQHDAAIDTYNTTINALEQQIANFKRPAYVVDDDEEIVAKLPTVSAPKERIVISNEEDDRMKVLRYFYEGNYKTKMIDHAIDDIVAVTKLTRPEISVILTTLKQEGLFEDNAYNLILTDKANNLLVKMFSQSTQIKELI